MIFVHVYFGFTSHIQITLPGIIRLAMFGRHVLVVIVSEKEKANGIDKEICDGNDH